MQCRRGKYGQGLARASQGPTRQGDPDPETIDPAMAAGRASATPAGRPGAAAHGQAWAGHARIPTGHYQAIGRPGGGSPPRTTAPPRTPKWQWPPKAVIDYMGEVDE